jgi:3-oxoacyl-[acyl-carrier protein] reductase
MTFDFSDEVILITGAGSGIGAALTRACSEAGAAVYAADVNFEATKFVTDSAPGPGPVEPVELDVSDEAAVRDAVGRIVGRHGRIDALVAGAAVQPRVAVAEMSTEEWQRTLDINVNGVFQCVRAVVPAMSERRRGSIVTFTSGLATMGWAKASAYATSKGALVSFFRCLAKELVDVNVRANIVSPGVTATPIFLDTNTEAEQEYFRRTTGIGTPEQVVPVLMFLISDASATLTGAVLSRDIIIPRWPSLEAGSGNE